MSWSRNHDELSYKEYNYKPSDLAAEDAETFSMLLAWGARLEQGLMKLHCGEIIKAGAESPEALKAPLYPEVALRQRVAEEKKNKKAEQKRSRLGTPNTESISFSPRVESASPQVLLAESYQGEIPSVADFAANLRVCECVARLAEEVEDNPELLILRKKLKKAEAVNCDLGSDLMDREDKLKCCNSDIVPNLFEENRYLRSSIASLFNAKAETAAAEGVLAAQTTEVEKSTAVQKELEEILLLEEEEAKSLSILQAQVAALESELRITKVKTTSASLEEFLKAQDLAMVLAPDMDLEFFDEENEAMDRKIIRLREGGEPEILFDPSEEKQDSGSMA